jgi:hypothetical protein
MARSAAELRELDRKSIIAAGAHGKLRFIPCSNWEISHAPHDPVTAIFVWAIRREALCCATF